MNAEIISSTIQDPGISATVLRILSGLGGAEKTKLGKPCGRTFTYIGGTASDGEIVHAGTNFVQFEHGVAVYFKRDPLSNPDGDGGKRSFFIHRPSPATGKDDSVLWGLYSHRDDFFLPHVRDSDEWKWKEVVPECREPVSGIGSAWRANEWLKGAMGFASSCEEAFLIEIQQFEGGWIICNVPTRAPPIAQSPDEADVNLDHYILTSEPTKKWDGYGRWAGRTLRRWADLPADIRKHINFTRTK